MLHIDPFMEVSAVHVDAYGINLEKCAFEFFNFLGKCQLLCKKIRKTRRQTANEPMLFHIKIELFMSLSIFTFLHFVTLKPHTSNVFGSQGFVF